MNDPRAFLTEEKTSKSLSLMKKEICRYPEKLRFAYMLCVFNEIGRKIASKLNYYYSELNAALAKEERPEASMLLDVLTNVFENKNDEPGADPQEVTIESMVTIRYKRDVVDITKKRISLEFGHVLASFFVNTSNSCIQIEADKLKTVALMLSGALANGALGMIKEISTSDKFKIDTYTNNTAKDILMMSHVSLVKQVVSKNDTIEGPIRLDVPHSELGYDSLGEISTKNVLYGPWTSYLFTNLGSSERVIKVFANLLKRVPNSLKPRWINAYTSPFYVNLEATLPAFISLQAYPQIFNQTSQSYMIESKLPFNIADKNHAQFREGYLNDKNRLPSRCYLAGRRWRLMMFKGLKGFNEAREVIDRFADRLDKIKKSQLQGSGNELARLCLPKLLVGFRGLSIDGDVDSNKSDIKRLSFPFKSPIPGLRDVEHPFSEGYKFGYRIGFKIAYNRERNATLELESSIASATSRESRASQVSKLSYRDATSAAAIRVFDDGLRVGYLKCLELRLESGIKLAGQAGSRAASSLAINLAQEAGKESGRKAADDFISSTTIPDQEQDDLIELGRRMGLLAGKIIGAQIGLLTGQIGAEQAFKHRLVRGDSLKIIKFNYNQYLAGASEGLQYGLGAGKRVAASSSLDPSAPRFLRYTLGQQKDHGLESDIWGKNLIPQLDEAHMNKVHELRNDTRVRGSFSGSYNDTRYVQTNLEGPSQARKEDYNLVVDLSGYDSGGMTFLMLNATVNQVGKLSGFLITDSIHKS